MREDRRHAGVYEADSGDSIADVLELSQLMKGSSFEDYRILITRVDSRKTRTNEAMRQVLDHWQDKHFSTTIHQPPCRAAGRDLQLG